LGLCWPYPYVDGQRELWRLQAFTNATPASWREFFSGLPGSPPRIVCDAHSGMLKVIEERWPQTEIYLCEWHLRHALERLLVKIAGKTAEQLLPRTEAAFAGRHFWAAFDADARQLGDARLNAWLERWSPIIASQLARRPRGKPDASDQPRSTGGLETFVKPIEAAFYRRRYAMKNRERLNRLLLLLQLEANGHADERAYAKDIRDWLELTGGRPSTARARSPMPPPGPRCATPAHVLPQHARRATRASDAVTPATWDDLAE
jgi:transposase-like protein